MAKPAKANGAATIQVGDGPEVPLEDAVAAAEAATTTEQPKRGPGRPRKERSTGNGPTAEQEAETLAALVRLDTEAARISQEKGTVLGRFEKIGGDKKAIKTVKSLLMLDKREAVAYLDKLLGYATRAEIAVTWQPDGQAALTDMLADDAAAAPPKNMKGTRDLRAAKAEVDGYNSGKAGARPSDNPFSHAPGSEEYVSWHDGRDSAALGREMRSGLTDRIAAAEGADASLPEIKPIDIPF